ncbi:tetratricopeptide repeat protein [Streptomyces ipomoeae]|uniref:Tetratricopeptide repeat protein n=1 Tax=Streptomyces ipomoeae TaxID=103232 RepID=A0AAE9AYE3_9ACTN|nr:tetratricopeptide repeat protein [Streptomyces ipomoeae]TQE25709.1 tetratricopeptide repeat protein [Streptomyces ipomoeae]TQE28630.1 tetratricopeptide repeat protein [Streptomyces ipomoeae]
MRHPSVPVAGSDSTTGAEGMGGGTAGIGGIEEPGGSASSLGGGDGGQVNSLGGAARVTGTVVQARDVHGGVHTHLPPVVPPMPVPRQLPPPVRHFTDREGDLAALGRLLPRRTGLVVVTGPAGVGKTSLVTRWLRRIGDDFPDGQLYADLRGHDIADAAGPGEILGRFLRSLYRGPIPADTAEQSALWRSLTTGLRLAVLLDNACTAAQTRPLLPGSDDSLVVVTGRRRLTGLGIDGAAFHTLDVMPPDAAEELLIRGVGRERVADDPAAAREVVDLCGGLPLALCVASARLAARPRQPLRALAEALARPADRLAVLAVEGETAVRGALDESYRALPAPAARLYRLLGQLPTPELDSRLAAAAGALTLDEADGLLDVLVESHLLQDLGEDRYRFHDLIRLHARQHGADHERAEALRRAGDWYLATATAAEQLITPAQFTLERADHLRPDLEPPFTDEPGALAWLDHHRVNLMAVLRAAAERHWSTLTWQLVDAMWPLFLRLRHYDLWIEAHELGLAAARRAGHAEAERQMLNSGAIGLSAARRFDEAITWYAASRDAARVAGDRRDEGQALLGLGAAHFEAGRRAEAVPLLEQAISLWEEAGYPRGTGLARIVLGEIALAADDPLSAVAYFEGAHGILTEVRDPHDAARALAFLGRARARTGEHEAGVDRLRAALEMFERSGALHWQARTLEMLGQSAEDAGDVAAARDYYRRALPLSMTVSAEDTRRVEARLEGLAGA